MPSDTGSFVVNRFIQGSDDNIFEHQDGAFLGDILNEIQDSLHKLSRQTVNCVFP